MSMDKRETFSKHLYTYFTKIEDDVWDDIEMGALQLLKNARRAKATAATATTTATTATFSLRSL